MSFVFDVRKHGIFANILVDQLYWVKNTFEKLRGRNGYLQGMNIHFSIQDIIWNAFMKHSARLAANTCVIWSVLIKERNAKFLPQWSSIACLNL